MVVIDVFPKIWIGILLVVFDLSLFQNYRLSSFSSSSSHFALAFNIDEEFPIIISNNFNGQEAHFGASVVLLPFNKSSGGVSIKKFPEITGWVLIGAPKANASTSVNNSNIFEPGVIWRCALGSAVDHWQNGDVGNTGRLCEIVEIDPTGEYDPIDPRLPFKDKKDGGWVGGSMFVGDSHKFVTCASRWINQKYNSIYLLNGICYWLPDTELTKDVGEDGSYWPKLESDLSYRLSPLLNKSRQIYKSETEKRDDWAFGQFGFSIHLTADNEMIAGAPGTLDWTGSIVYYRDNSSPNPLLRRFNAQNGISSFSEVLVVSAQTLRAYLQPSDYFGYSVTSGKFFASNITNNRTQFAAGAPRASNLSGKVIVFTLNAVEGAQSEGKLNVLGEPLEGQDTGKGNHYCSYFGHTLLGLDVNGDGFDDLLVSAPLYGTSVRYKRNSDPEENEGISEEYFTAEGRPPPKRKSGDEGCVFVYLSTGYQAEFTLPPQDLCGDKAAGARFGMALSSLRDINNDGFNDIAVGAPYENEGRGAVYIYHGGMENMELAQKLEPKRIHPHIRTFGWSVSLGEDIDANSYPDLAVGAYETNQVVIYRTIPVINFSSKLTASIPKLLSTTEEFNLTTCITYSGRGVIPPLLAIWVKLTVEVGPDEKRLVALKDQLDSGALLLNGSLLSTRSRRGSDGQPLYLLSYKQRLYFQSSGEGNCYNFSAAKIKQVDDGLTKVISIRQDYWLDNHDREVGDTKPIFYEISPQQVFTTANLTIPYVTFSQSKSRFSDFRTKLPLPAGNMFGTDRLLLPVGTICEGDGDPQCLANLTISAWLKDYNSGEIYNSSRPFTLGTNDTLALEVELKNHREAATLPLNLILHWSRPPTVRIQPSNCVNLSISGLSCSMSKLISEQQTELMTIFLDMSGVKVGSPEETNQLRVSVEATSSAALVQPAIHELVVDLATHMRPHSYMHISNKIEYSSGNVSIPTFGFTQAFEVALEGPSTAPMIEVTFDIPTGFVLPDKKSGRGYQLIGVKTPICTYDDDTMECHAVGGSFLEDEDRPREMDSKRITRSTFQRNLETLDGPIQHNLTTTRMFSNMKSSLWSHTSRTYPNEQTDLSGVLKLNCNSTSKSVLKITCLRVICKATHFSPSKKAVVELKLRMFKTVAAKLLAPQNYDKVMDPDLDSDLITSLWVETTGVVRTLSGDGKPFGESASLRYISRLEIPPPPDIPAWILLMSVASGLLLFTVVTIVLKKCGFFQRSKRDLLIKRKVEEIERSRLLAAEQDSPSPSSSSTAKIPSSTSSRRHTTTHTQYHSSRYRGGGTSNEDKVSNSISFPFPSGEGVSGSILGMSVSSPGTAVKQREIPGAMDLKELRRLYDFAYIDDSPGQSEYF